MRIRRADCPHNRACKFQKKRKNPRKIPKKSCDTGKQSPTQTITQPDAPPKGCTEQVLLGDPFPTGNHPDTNPPFILYAKTLNVKEKSCREGNLFFPSASGLAVAAPGQTFSQLSKHFGDFHTLFGQFLHISVIYPVYYQFSVAFFQKPCYSIFYTAVLGTKIPQKAGFPKKFLIFLLFQLIFPAFCHTM